MSGQLSDEAIWLAHISMVLTGWEAHQPLAVLDSEEYTLVPTKVLAKLATYADTAAHAAVARSAPCHRK